MGDIVSLDFRSPRRNDLALAIACMRAHARSLRRAMMASESCTDAVAKLGGTKRIEEAAQRLELALNAFNGQERTL